MMDSGETDGELLEDPLGRFILMSLPWLKNSHSSQAQQQDLSRKKKKFMDSGETDVEFHYHIMFAPEQIANPYNSLVCNIKL